MTAMGWHFLTKTRKLSHSDFRPVVAGESLRVEHPEQITLCRYGLHASIKALDALRFSFSLDAVVCRVALRGHILFGDDKMVGEERHCYWMADAGMEIAAFNLWMARRVIRKAKNENLKTRDYEYALYMMHLYITGMINSREMFDAAPRFNLSLSQYESQLAQEAIRSCVLLSSQAYIPVLCYLTYPQTAEWDALKEEFNARLTAGLYRLKPDHAPDEEV